VCEMALRGDVRQRCAPSETRPAILARIWQWLVKTTLRLVKDTLRQRSHQPCKHEMPTTMPVGPFRHGYLPIHAVVVAG
jgi:hypothetical protein